MGRTLHWKMVNDHDFTPNEEEALCAISEQYNTGPFESFWTCENYWCTTVDFYPNWNKFHNRDMGYKAIKGRLEKLQGNGLSYVQAVKKMAAEGIVVLFAKKANELQSFCKTQGNEANSFAVLCALLDVSVSIPSLTISLSDEGEFLYGDIFIRNGKVCPDLAKAHARCKRLKKSFGEKDPCTQEAKRNLAYIKKTLKQRWPLEGNPTIKAVSSLDPDLWFPPALFHRHADWSKFIGKNYSIMSGFYGEGFGLSDPEEADLKSMKITKVLQDAFGEGNIATNYKIGG